ncbi:MAG: hypothetical protein AB7R89_25915 [Dehalococcoidia bacterium]
MAWFDRLLHRPAKPREPVELDLHQQIALLTLARFGPCSFNRLFAEVSATRRTTQAELVNGVLKLETAAVIERLVETNLTQTQRRYALTRRGKRIVRYIPREPRSAMEFYV